MRKKALWLSLPNAALFPEPGGKLLPPRRKRVSAMSNRRKQEYRIYTDRRVIFLESHPRCQRCGTWSECIHHWAGRRSNLLKEETWRASCLPCNKFAKDCPAQARKENWIAPVGVYLT